MRPLQIVSYMDGRLGHEKQTKGILQALSRLTPILVEQRLVGHPKLKTAVKNWIVYVVFRWLPGKKKDHVVDLIIGTGASTHIPMLMYKKKCGAKVVTCMTPDFPLRYAMDLCLVPQHDGLKPAPNIYFTIGPPNNVIYSDLHDRDKGLILVGGVDPKSHQWRSETVIEQIGNILARNKSVTWTISSSPRTPQETLLQLDRLASQHARATFFRSEDTSVGWIEEQYARNDIVWVTADSISMIFEALTAGCRVGVLPVEWKRRDNKFQRSLDYLLENNRITLYPSWLAGAGLIPGGAHLDEAFCCAKEILRRWWPERLQ